MHISASDQLQDVNKKTKVQQFPIVRKVKRRFGSEKPDRKHNLCTRLWIICTLLLCEVMKAQLNSMTTEEHTELYTIITIIIWIRLFSIARKESALQETPKFKWRPQKHQYDNDVITHISSGNKSQRNINWRLEADQRQRYARIQSLKKVSWRCFMKVETSKKVHAKDDR